MEEHTCVIDIGKMPFFDSEFFLRAELVDYNVMTFDFLSDSDDDIDLEFVNFVSKLKGWYSAYIIQQAESNYLQVTFVTKINAATFINRINCIIDKKGGIKYV